MKRSLKPIARVVLACTAAAALGAAAISAFGATTYEVDGVSLILAAQPAVKGETALKVPPFGEISAYTHKSPVRLSASLERVYPDKIEKVADEAKAGNELVAKIERDALVMMRAFVLRLIAIAGIGGAVGSLLAGRKPRYAPLGLLIGSVGAAAVLGAAYGTYDVNAFRQPRYEGALTAAPWMTEALADRLGAFKTFRKEIQEVAGNVHEFYSKVSSWEPIRAGDGDIRVLHVSDIHANPAALDLVSRIAKDYRASFIIDTGDATDFGTPLEVSFLKRIGDLKLPYVFVPGNHDSPESISKMKSLPNVRVLEVSQVEIAGISVLGIADPASYSASTVDADAEQLRTATRNFRKLALSKKPEIAAAHNPGVARSAFGVSPVVLTGHAHRPSIEIKGGFALINAGSTGAAGLRTFREDKGLPYALQILHFKKDPLRLIAVDTVTVYGLEREFRLERRLIDGAPKSADASGQSGSVTSN